jgi:integrase
MLRELQDDVEDGRYVPSAVTVLELGRKWLAEHVQPNLKPGAAATYRGTFYGHVAPALGAVRLDDVRPQMIMALLGKKRAEGLSEETVGKIRRQVHAMFAFAQDAGMLSVNPADAARARGSRQARRRARGTQLSPVQIKRFLDECSPRWRSFFTVALDSGLRRGELIGLRWRDIDLLQRILYVRRSIGAYDEPNAAGSEERLTTKTEAGQRLVPILDGAQAALEQLYATAKDTDDDAPVFATVERKRGRDGTMRAIGRPLSPRMVTRVFRRYAERAGLEPTVRLHDLRHTAITNAIGQGEDILLVAAFAGHAKTSTTVDVYGHLMPDRVREAARRMRSVSGPDTPARPSVSPPVRQRRPILFARRVDSTSLAKQGPLGPGATVTMRLERATARRGRSIEQGQTDPGGRIISVEGTEPNTRAGARPLAPWDPYTEPRTPRDTASTGEQTSRESPTPGP